MITDVLLTPQEAAERMRGGGVVAYPTEAVFGLGCDPANEAAVQRILSLKHRSAGEGLILIGSRFSQFDGWVADVDGSAADETWPGPVTWLFPRGEKTPDWIAGDHAAVAIRVTAHETCRALCDAFGGPIVSTSANPHSAPPARAAGTVEDYFGHYIAGTVAGGLGGEASVSEIRDLVTGERLRSA